MKKNTNKNKELPPTGTKRWVRSRKMAVVEAIEEGRLTETQAMERYNLSEEELLSWQHMLSAYGPDALRTTHLKKYRNHDLEQQGFQMIASESGPGSPVTL